MQCNLEGKYCSVRFFRDKLELPVHRETVCRVLVRKHISRISLPQITPDKLEFILVNEEPRKVRKTAAITYYGHYYRVLQEYIKRSVWTKLKGSTLIIECRDEVIARYKVREERYQDIPKSQP